MTGKRYHEQNIHSGSEDPITVIAERSGLTTLVVVYTVEPAKQTELASYLEDVANRHSRHPGFVSCAIHRSEDGAKVLEYIQWRSKADLQAMLATPDGQNHLGGRGGHGDMHFYEVGLVVDAARPSDPLRKGTIQ